MRQPQQSLGASRQHLNLGHVVQPQSPLATCTPEIDDGKQEDGNRSIGKHIQIGETLGVFIVNCSM